MRDPLSFLRPASSLRPHPSSLIPHPLWPEGKRFAFTVFDDTDSATLENVGEVYALLSDLGFRTTKTCWPLRGDVSTGANAGQTAQDDDYRRWLLGLQAKGFEIGWHGASWQSSRREDTIRGLDAFAALFGHDPRAAANHTGQAEGMYWAEKRLSGVHVLLYDLLTRMRQSRPIPRDGLRAIRTIGATSAGGGSSTFGTSSFRTSIPSRLAR